MIILAYIGIIIFTVLLGWMSYKQGALLSLSALSKNYRWTLLIALWSQILLLPQMISMTPVTWQFLAALAIAGVIFAGAADIYVDETVHMIAAVIGFILLSCWLIVINPMYLIPAVICSLAGRDKFKWRLEIGLLIGVYMCILF